MRIVPVIDILDGQVVRGIGGRRDDYRPVKSRLTDSSDPVVVARAFRDQLGLAQIYVADLDAILHAAPHLTLYAQLAREGFDVWIDAGLRDAAAAEPIVALGAGAVIVALETVDGPWELAQSVARFGPQRVIFSLDLQGGRPLGDPAAWSTDDPFEIALSAVDQGVERMIVLDLAQVGVGRGVPTAGLCARMRSARPSVQLTAGGGVGGLNDLLRLRSAGVSAVLVASALHDGRIDRDMLRRLHATN